MELNKASSDSCKLWLNVSLFSRLFVNGLESGDRLVSVDTLVSRDTLELVGESASVEISKPGGGKLGQF